MKDPPFWPVYLYLVVIAASLTILVVTVLRS